MMNQEIIHRLRRARRTQGLRPSRLDAITQFRGNYAFLSNFYDCVITFEGDDYPSVENAYQAAKCSSREARKVFTMISAPVAKRLGHAVFVRPDWETVKIVIMLQLVRHKFTRYSEFQKALLATGDRDLIEDNYWGDTFWGVCRGQGTNHLGKILMKVRFECRKGIGDGL